MALSAFPAIPRRSLVSLSPCDRHDRCLTIAYLGLKIVTAGRVLCVSRCTSRCRPAKSGSLDAARLAAVERTCLCLSKAFDR